MAAADETKEKTGYQIAQEEREAAKGFAREAGTRAEASAQELRGYLPRAQELEKTGLAGLQGAQQRGKMAARQEAARGLAAAQTGGGFGGGARTAQLKAAGESLGKTRSDIEAESQLQQEKFKQGAMQQQMGISETAGQAEVESSVQKLEGEKFAREAGTQQEDRAEKLRKYQEQMAKIKSDSKGGFFEDDDEEGAAAAIQAMANAEEDPELKKVLQDEVNRIKEEGWLAF